MKWLLRIFGGLSLVMLVSCARQNDQPQRVVGSDDVLPAAQESKTDGEPSLNFESPHELPFGAGTKIMIWNLRGMKIKELSARLLVCTDGQAKNASEIACQWQDSSRPMMAELALLVQDGQAFGVKAKRLPSLSLSFSSNTPNVKSEKRMEVLISGDLPSRMSSKMGANSISRKETLFAEIFAPQRKGSESFSLGRSEDDLVKESRGGRVVLAVIVEWKP